MDYSPLKHSFKTHNSYKNAKKDSENGASTTSHHHHSNYHEELPILSSHHHREIPSAPSVIVDRINNNNNNNEVIVKVDASGSNSGVGSSSSSSSNNSNCSGNKTRREPSFGYLRGDMEEDPPSKLINQFLRKQKNCGGEISLEIDMEMDELMRELHDKNLPPSREIRVSFEPSFSKMDSGIESVRRRYKDLQDLKQEDQPTFSGSQQNQQHHQNQKRNSGDEVLKCTSNRLSRLKTKSRLLDPPQDELERMSVRLPPKSGQLKSGMIGKDTDNEGEDDPLDDDFDFPEEYKSSNISTMTVLQCVSLIAIIACLICSLSISGLKEQRLLELKLWKWEVLLLVLICGRLVSGWGIRIIVFFIERNFLLRKRVLYFVYGLKNGVQNCWWLGLVLLAWHFLFDTKVKREMKGDLLKYVTKILVCFLVANFVWLLKTLMVKVLASSFHVSTYFDRIQESLFNQYVIETLSGPPLIEIQRNEEELEKAASEVRKLQNAGATVPPELRAVIFPSTKSGKTNSTSERTEKSFRGVKSFKFSKQLSKRGGDKKTDTGITIDRLHKLNNKNVSAWNMKRLMNIVRHGSLSTLDEQILDASTGDESATIIRSEYEAKAAARKIFHNVARHGSKYINLEDLLRFMQEDEVLRTMSFFEGARESSRISKSSLKNWVVNAFRERRALALTLNDTKTAVNKLHQVVNIIVGVIIIVIWLLILGIATSKFVVFMGSQIVVVSFIFGNTAKTLFESIIFLFLVHPFDVGDRCEVDGNQLVVEEMNILTTVFLRADNLKIVYHNNILATKAIGNYYRSPEMGDAIEFFVHISTPMEKIALMKQRIISVVEAKKEHWLPNPMVIVKEFEDLSKVRVALWLGHRINHQDMGERYERRAMLMEEMVKIFKELDIQYRLYPLDININSMPSFNSFCPS